MTRALCLAVALVCVPVHERPSVVSTAVTPPQDALVVPPTAMPSGGESQAQPAVISSTMGTESPQLPEVNLWEPPALPAFPPPLIDLTVLPLSVRRVALDPGHGGKDLGTTSPLGLLEKEVVLDIALRLRRLLEQAAFEVVMTRDTDEAIPLRQRTAFANAQRADVFISIHVNWVKRSQARGIETYYLGPTDDPSLRQLVAHENRDSGYALADFRKLLDHIYLSVRRDASKRLADTVHHALMTTLYAPNDTQANRG